MKRTTTSFRFILLFTLSFLGHTAVNAQSFEKTKNFQKFKGYFDFYYDDAKDRMYLDVSELDKEFLYVNSLSNGVGSNDIGLDRGQLGGEQVVFFRKVGSKLLLVQPNLKYRALTANEFERKSVEQAFAQSVWAGFPILEESTGHYLIDMTDFLMQDAHGVAARLRQRGQGSFTLDKSKSAFSLERTKGFPKNVEWDVLLTFSGSAKGSELRSVTPNSSRVTVSQHHSFIQLPEAGYKTREYDPRSGSYPFTYYDYASPVQEPTIQRFIRRHRLEKKNPKAAVSEAVEPIIYYLDNGTPEPVRSALLEGGRWWNQAFEAIGYKNAFQVKILPDDADPLDVRYNVIQWVHRSTRGWSYGASVVDPRTGEIIKGHVSLGSLRIRQDFMIAQALMDKPYAERDDNDSQMLALALARIRQLSAHEIGHTLGFAHNFAASTNNRASVMDYPHPQFRLKDGKIDFSDAYAVGIGDWDKVSVAYAYGSFPTESESEDLRAVLDKAYADGLRYITDQDARPAGSAHAGAHLWDNGSNPATELMDVLSIRQKAIAQFSEYNVRKNKSYSELEDVFVPLYFFHRYQTEGVAKMIGGLDYNYSIRGDGQLRVATLSRKAQQEALDGVLKTLQPEVLAIPSRIQELFPPRGFGYSRSRESFRSKMGVAFDPLAAAETSANFSLYYLLRPERANRLILQKANDTKQLGLAEVVDQLLKNSFDHSASGMDAAIQEVVQWRVLDHLMGLAADDSVYPQVRATIVDALQDLSTRMKKDKKGASTALLVAAMDKFAKNPYSHKTAFEVVQIPDGSPIGQACSGPDLH